MKKAFIVFSMLAAFAGLSFAEDSAPVFDTASGTASATVYVPAGNGGVVKLTDISYRVDAGNVSSTINVHQGKRRVAVTSATAAVGTTLWYDATTAASAAQDYVILEDTSAGTFIIHKILSVASAGTSATVNWNLPALAVTDNVWICHAVEGIPADYQNTSGTTKKGEIYLDGRTPSAITLDGNTTSCRISVNGVRVR